MGGDHPGWGDDPSQRPEQETEAIFDRGGDRRRRVAADRLGVRLPRRGPHAGGRLEAREPTEIHPRRGDESAARRPQDERVQALNSTGTEGQTRSGESQGENDDAGMEKCHG